MQSSVVPPKKKLRVISHYNGYYVPPEDRKFEHEHEEIVSEILGEDIDEKINISKKAHRFPQKVKKEQYESYQRVNTVDKVLKELDKRLSADSKKVLSNYQQPDYKTLKEFEDNIDLLLKPNPLLPPNNLSFNTVEYFKDGAEIKKLTNEIELDEDKRAEQLLNQFPKVKTNTALLQYAHLLSKESLKNKYLEKKHQEFLDKIEIVKQEDSSKVHAMHTIENDITEDGQEISSGLNMGLHIGLKHNYNRNYKPTKESLEQKEFTETLTEVVNRASLQTNSSKVVRMSNSVSTQTSKSISPEPMLTNSTGGTSTSSHRYSISKRQRYGAPSTSFVKSNGQAKWSRAANTYRLMYGGGSVILNNDYQSLLQQQRAIKFNMLCLAEERNQKKTSADLKDSIDYIKSSFAGFDPVNNTRSIENKNLIEESKVQTFYKSTPKNITVQENSEEESPILKLALINPTPSLDTIQPASTEPILRKSSSELILRSSTAESTKSIVVSSLEQPPIVSTKKAIFKKGSKNKKINTALESIVEVTSLIENRRSVAVTGDGAHLMLTTMKTIDNAKKFQETGYSDMEELEKKLSKKLVKKSPITEQNIGKNILVDAPPTIISRRTAKACAYKIPDVADPEKNSIHESREAEVKEIKTKELKKLKKVEPQLKKKYHLNQSKSMLSFFKRSKKNVDKKHAPPPIPEPPIVGHGQYADIKCYDDLIDNVTIASIAGTVEHKDNIKIKGLAPDSRLPSRAPSTQSKLRTMVNIDPIAEDSSSSESDSDMHSCEEQPTPETIASDFSDETYSMVDLNDTDIIEAKLKRDLKRSTVFTEYNFFSDKEVELIFDDEKFNKDYITFDQKRQSFDIFKTYMLATTKMEVNN